MKQMILKTRVFELSNGRYKNLSELAQAIGISTAQLYRVREGTRNIDQKLITGVMRTFPGYKLDDLFYLAPDGQVVTQSTQGLPVGNKEGVEDMGGSGNGRSRITYAEIARRLGINRERVRQIANKQKPHRQSKVTISSRINEVPNHPEAMLTTREVAQLLNLHVNTVRRWSNQGILRTYRIGPRSDRRFKRQDIDNFLLKKSKASKRS